MTRHGSGHIYGPSTSISSKAVLAVALFLSLGSAAKAATLTLDDLSEGDLILTEVMIDPVAKEDYRAEWFEVWFYDGASGGTPLYPGTTTANSSATSMLAGWDNRVSSVYIT